LAQYERDRFHGFPGRYVVWGGLGYDVIAEDNMTLSADVGPA
jgi:putative salt-induced outer membrane protein